MGLSKKKVAILLGTRPEAIKMAPVVRAVQASSSLTAVTCSTGQHREMLDQVLSFFEITPDIDLDLMRKNQDLFDVTTGCLTRLKGVFEELRPDFVLVQGDTTTAFASAVAAFYSKIPVGHIEAGLRTWNRMAPFPEEAYRRMISEIADFHFAPTGKSHANLISEGLDEKTLFLTGNTGIDALMWAAEKTGSHPLLEERFAGKKLILMTAHRRENFGEPLRNILNSIKEFALANSDFHIVYPVHPNPNVVQPAEDILANVSNVSLVSPLNYQELVFLLKKCHLVLTDSGGLQEEAPTFGKPVLVFRETTERPEAVEAGCAKLVGSDPEKILGCLGELISDESPMYRHMSTRANPFGDGRASSRIVETLENFFAS